MIADTIKLEWIKKREYGVDPFPTEEDGDSYFPVELTNMTLNPYYERYLVKASEDDAQPKVVSYMYDPITKRTFSYYGTPPDWKCMSKSGDRLNLARMRRLRQDFEEIFKMNDTRVDVSFLRKRLVEQIKAWRHAPQDVSFNSISKRLDQVASTRQCVNDTAWSEFVSYGLDYLCFEMCQENLVAVYDNRGCVTIVEPDVFTLVDAKSAWTVADAMQDVMEEMLAISGWKNHISDFPRHDFGKPTGSLT